MWPPKWITDRVPGPEEADHDGYVWVTRNGKVELMDWDDVTDEPWMQVEIPTPYEKPKSKQWYVNSDDPKKLLLVRHWKDEHGIATERVYLPIDATMKLAERTAKLWNKWGELWKE